MSLIHDFNRCHCGVHTMIDDWRPNWQSSTVAVQHCQMISLALSEIQLGFTGTALVETQGGGAAASGRFMIPLTCHGRFAYSLRGELHMYRARRTRHRPLDTLTPPHTQNCDMRHTDQKRDRVGQERHSNYQCTCYRLLAIMSFAIHK